MKYAMISIGCTITVLGMISAYTAGFFTGGVLVLKAEKETKENAPD